MIIFKHKHLKYVRTSLVFALHLIPWPDKYLTLLYTEENCKINVVRVSLETGKNTFCCKYY